MAGRVPIMSLSEAFVILENFSYGVSRHSSDSFLRIGFFINVLGLYWFWNIEFVVEVWLP